MPIRAARIGRAGGVARRNDRRLKRGAITGLGRPCIRRHGRRRVLLYVLSNAHGSRLAALRVARKRGFGQRHGAVAPPRVARRRTDAAPIDAMSGSLLKINAKRVVEPQAIYVCPGARVRNWRRGRRSGTSATENEREADGPDFPLLHSSERNSERDKACS
jgi:hypothetical protein